ncbi:MAG: CHRD domain-containing protein [Candidatus Eisenbacteria bacterium]
MRLRLLLTVAVGLALAFAPRPADAALQFEAVINSAQEVPPNSSPATGTGTFTLNDAETQLSINVVFSGLVAPQTGAHIHGPAAPGVNAGIRFGLPLGSPVNVVWAISAGDVASLKDGLLYVNIHSQAFPGGEIRGQILASTPVRPSSWGKLKAIYASVAP